MGSAQESVSFDRAADFYDQTRSLPPPVAAAQTRLLAEQLSGVRGPVLEIGVGTGRVALPLAAAGFRVLGIDLSPAMLARLRAKDPTRPVPVAVADAAALPYPDASFGAALACHVLHLVADWVAAVDELARVVVPGGTLLVTRGAGSDGLRSEINARIWAETGMPGPVGRLDQLDGLDDLLAARGAVVQHLAPIERGPADPGRTVARYLAQTADNVYSWTWRVPPERLQSAVATVRDWVSTAHGDPAQVVLPEWPIRWHCYVLAGD